MFPDISSFFGKKHGETTIASAEDLCMYLLDKGVALVSGEAFGDANCMRISYAASEETLTEAMKRVADALIMLRDKFGKGQPSFGIHISREDLANIAGTATESLIRTLSDFKAEKLIDIKEGNIVLLNEKKLESLLN